MYLNIFATYLFPHVPKIHEIDRGIFIRKDYRVLGLQGEGQCHGSDGTSEEEKRRC